MHLFTTGISVLSAIFGKITKSIAKWKKQNDSLGMKAGKKKMKII